MKRSTVQATFSLALSAASAATSAAQAQEVLPFPPKPSGSIAGKTMQESVYSPLPAVSRLPKDAPNILIVLIDNVGPAQADTFGGEIHTPTMSKIASYNFKAEVEIPQGGAEGMLITQGGWFAGYGFYVLKNKPVFLWNLVDLKRIRWEGPELTPGKHTLEFDFKYDGLGAATMAFNNMSGIGRGGTGVLKVDGKEVAPQEMVRTIPFILQWDENLDIGSDTGSPVNDADYHVPFKFTGKINKITLTIDRPKLTPEDIKKLEQAQHEKKLSE